MANHGYTIEDMCAIADAHGCSYGAVQKHLEFGAPLPPQRKSVKWPKGSVHRGELQLGKADAAGAVPVPKTEPKPKPKARPAAKRKPIGLHCNRCGAQFPSDSLYRVNLHYQWSARASGNLAAVLCCTCAPKLLPMQKPSNLEKFPPTDDAGNRIGGRAVAKCHRCGSFHVKKEGAQIYIRQPGENTPHLMGYLCAVCAPEFETETKKAVPK